MRFTDIFINRPVLATVVSLLIFVFGVRAALNLSVREFPFTENAILTIQTPYTGANPELVSSFITSTLEQALAQSNGIDYMTSISSQGLSTIVIYLQTNYDIDKAMTEISSNLSSVTDQLPPEAQLTQITVDVGQATDVMFLGFYSDELSRTAITDYIIRIAQPKMRSIPGMLDAEILGLRQFALRAWLDPGKLASYGLDATDVFNALDNNDFLTAAGRSDGQMIAVNIMANTNLTSVDQFKDLIIGYVDGAVIKLDDVSTVSLGSQDYDSSVSFDDTTAVYLGLQVVPNGNVLEVVDEASDAFDNIQEQLPQGLKAKIIYDTTDFIHTSIDEVNYALFEAIIIVMLVIFLFLGTIRSVIIPIVAIPLSLVGTFLVMFLFGYSINILTLLAFVLAIGLVVDDAIIVVENIERHIKNGLSPYKAAIQGARELANPIIAITAVLIAVYLPIGFMGGLTGKLFTEFAFTLAGSVAISAIIALTLSPMMCAKFLKPEQEQSSKNRFAQFTERNFDKLHAKYERALAKSLSALNVTAVFSVIILVGLVFLFLTSKSELAPDEDQGVILGEIITSPNASVYQTELSSKDFTDRMRKFDETELVWHIDGAADQNGLPDGLNNSATGIVLKSWDDRDRTADVLMAAMQKSADQIAGAKVALYQPSPLPGTVGLPIQFAIVTTESYKKLWEVSNQFMEAAQATGMFSYIDNDLKLDMLQATIDINRQKAASLGLQMSDIGSMLSAALSQNYVNFFDLDGRAYQVIPQMTRKDRINYDQVLNYYITTGNGDEVPLSTFATIKTDVVPESINHFDQLLAATISAVPNSGVMMGTAIETLESLAEKILPAGYDVNYGGESRQYEQEHSALLITFMFSMFIIFLSLAALFESFRDPTIILISVPMSVFGALLFINLEVGGASLNIYSEVGLVTLIGLISKHGILIVQFANTLQEEGLSKLDAIIKAAGIRLRPILMTTGAMVLGVIPLIIASGAGAEGRFNIGLVIATGISIGTLFTLFVVPAMYMFLAKVHHSDELPT
jgi:multidrug efflux pump